MPSAAQDAPEKTHILISQQQPNTGYQNPARRTHYDNLISSKQQLQEMTTSEVFSENHVPSSRNANHSNKLGDDLSPVAIGLEPESVMRSADHSPETIDKARKFDTEDSLMLPMTSS